MRETLRPALMVRNGLHTLVIASLISVGSATLPSAAAPAPASHSHCPDRLDDLTALLLRDLPSYANRVNQRAYDRPAPDPRPAELPGYILVAGQPEFAPLSLGPGVYTPAASSDTSQIFFTTLERQYVDSKAVNLQGYHWLFLTHIASGWRFVIMFSALGGYPASQKPTTPPQDSSQGVVAQAIRLWLRDCQAGSLRPVVR